MKYSCVATTVLGFLALTLAACLWVFTTLELIPVKPPALNKGSKLAEIYARPPAPYYLKLYVFNITNSADWLQNKTTKAALTEHGPYVFRMETLRTLDWSGDKLLLSENTRYYFEASKSNGTLDDVVTTVDFTVLFLTSSLETTRSTEESIFFNVSIKQYFFDGFKETGQSFAQSWILENNQEFSWFGRLNTTSLWNLTVQTKPGSVNQVITVNNRTHLPHYESCGNVTGKIAGTRLLPAFSTSPATVEVFEPTFAVPRTLHLQEQYSVGYEPIARYMADRDLLSGMPKTCQSFRPTYVNGTYDLSPIYSFKNEHILPVVLSLPHFLYGDPALLTHIDGLKSNESKHRLYIDVHAPSGVVVDKRLRSQINVIIFPLENESLAEVTYPIFWQEISMLPEGKQVMVAAVKTWSVFAGWVAVACVASLLAAALLFGASVLLLGPIDCSDLDEERPHTPDDIPTDELSSEPEEDLRREQRRRALRARLPAGLPVYFKIHEGDLDDLGVTIPDWVMEKIQRQIEEQGSSSTDEDSSDLPSVEGSCTWSTVSSRSTSPDNLPSEVSQAPTFSQPASQTQHKPATPDQEEEGGPSKGCESANIEQAQNESCDDVSVEEIQ